jgi:hypothetical protein
MSQYGVVLFSGTQAALRAEKLLERVGQVVKLIPTPRHLSSDCGVALRFSWAEQNEVVNTLDRARLAYETIAILDG